LPQIRPGGVLMDTTIALILIQDGLVTGSIYALLAIALVLVFTVTRVILIPQGAFVAFASLSFNLLERGQRPGTAGLLVALGVAAFLIDIVRNLRLTSLRWLMQHALTDLIFPVTLYGLVRWVAPMKLGTTVDIILTCALIAPLGPFIYRLAFKPMANAPVLVLLIASLGVHLALTVLGLIFFGPEGFVAEAFSRASFNLGPLMVPGQNLIILGVVLALMIASWLTFERTLLGKALRAVAVNRVGALIVGIPISTTGEIAFGLAGLIGAISGVLISPVTMIYYDSGFLIGLMGFVAAIVGGMGSYPLAVVGAFGVGILQSFAAFWNSGYTTVIVFMSLIPILLLRSLWAPVVEEEE
jgi:branched-chain amino acid transport system permease protein